MTQSDDLGRVVIPKEIRRTMRIREGDPLEIFTDQNGEVVFKKYSVMGGLGELACNICETLNKTTGRMVAVSDRDTVIAVAGVPKRELNEKRISTELESIMEGRQIYQMRSGDPEIPIADGTPGYKVALAAPILSEGDVMGCVLVGGKEGDPPLGEIEYKLAQTIAGFLGRHMES